MSLALIRGPSESGVEGGQEEERPGGRGLPVHSGDPGQGLAREGALPSPCSQPHLLATGQRQTGDNLPPCGDLLGVGSQVF